MKHITSFLILLIFGCLACDPSSPAPTTIQISGITARNIFGVPSQVDADDWKIESDWPDFIIEKFDFADTLNYTTENDSPLVSDIMAYPNPCNSQVALRITNTKSTIMKYIIVDSDIKLYQQASVRLHSSNSSIILGIPSSTFASGKLYRLYYAFYDKNKNIYAKGYGDLQIQ